MNGFFQRCDKAGELHTMEVRLQLSTYGQYPEADIWFRGKPSPPVLLNDGEEHSLTDLKIKDPKILIDDTGIVINGYVEQDGKYFKDQVMVHFRRPV